MGLSGYSSTHWPPGAFSESMTCAFRPSRPSSNTWNRPHGPAPTMTTSVLIGWRSNLSAESVCVDTRYHRERHRQHEIGCERLVEPGRLQQSLFREPFAIEQTRLVLRTGVAQDRHDRVTGAQPPRDLQSRSDVHAAGAAEEQPFFAQQLINSTHALNVGDVQRVVERRTFEIRGYAADADAFGD